jgi:hypothetical protein
MARDVAVCRCPACQHEGEHPNRMLHEQMNLLLSRLDEAQRRWFAALESIGSVTAGMSCCPR